MESKSLFEENRVLSGVQVTLQNNGAKKQQILIKKKPTHANREARSISEGEVLIEEDETPRRA